MESAPGKSSDSYVQYREEIASSQVVGALRFGILVVVGLHVPFLVLDYLVFPDAFMTLTACRVSNAATLLMVYAVAPRSPVPAMLVACLVAGFHLIAVIGVAGGVSSLYFPGLMLLFLGMPVLLPLSARQSALVAGVLFLTFAALPAIGFGQAGNQGYLVNLFFPGAAALESVFSCVLLDRFRYRDYLRREEIAAARDQLAILDDAKSRFSANVHHELRTPLTLMLAPLEGLRAGHYGGLQPASAKIVETMHSNGRRLLKLINNLLDLAKLENRQFPIIRQPVDLKDVVEDIVVSTAGLAAQKGLSVFSTVGDDVPSICADRDALDKVMINLIGNAMKFTESGGDVSIGGLAVDGGVEISVVDSGIGIAPDQLSRVFDRFAQVDHSETRKYEGTGIGLSLAVELVELHSGRLWATSEGIGSGATMHVFLPFGESDGMPQSVEAAIAEPPEASESPVGENDAEYAELDANVRRWADHGGSESDLLDTCSEGSANGDRVLVVDDNADMRELLRFILHKDFNVETARNGLEALSAIERELPSLVVTDVMMPEMSGTELCESIKSREATRDVPVMIVSSKAEGDMKAKGLELGADDYVTKPFHPREVLARARSLVSLRTARLDVAERNDRLEEALGELKQAQSKLVQSERLAAVGELAAGVAHEVNNPVNFALNAARALKVNVQELGAASEKVETLVGAVEVDQDHFDQLVTEIRELEPGTLGDEIIELSGIITDGLERAQKLVGDLRDFAAPKRSDAFTSMDLGEAVEASLALVAHEYSRLGIGLSVQCPTEGVCIIGDEGAIVQVIINLLKNSLDAVSAEAMAADAVAPGVSIAIKSSDAHAVLTVEDNGPGIAEADLARVFEPFFTTKQAGQGTGLGLSTCRGIAESHGGTLIATSAVGVGTRLQLLLPLDDGRSLV